MSLNLLGKCIFYYLFLSFTYSISPSLCKSKDCEAFSLYSCSPFFLLLGYRRFLRAINLQSCRSLGMSMFFIWCCFVFFLYLILKYSFNIKVNSIYLWKCSQHVLLDLRDSGKVSTLHQKSNWASAKIE